MSIQVVSTTDSKENVQALNSQMSPETKEVEQKQSAPVQDDESETDESTDESETSEDNLDEGEAESSTNDDEDEIKEDLKPKKSRGIQKRIAKFQQKLSAKDQEIEHWKQVALAGAGKPQDQAKPAADAANGSKPDITGKPKAENFDSHEDYIEALTDWKLEAREQAKEAKAKEEQYKTEYQKIAKSHHERLTEFKKTVPDFDEVIAEVDDVILSSELQESIATSDYGPQIMYDLSNNRSALERIAKLSNLAAIREIGKLEAKYDKGSQESQTKETKTITKTKAPPPIDPVGSKGTAKLAKSLSDPSLSQAEYERMREEQSAKRR